MAGLALPLPACAAPVGAVRVDPAIVHKELTSDALTTGEPSRFARNALVWHNLLAAFDDDPAKALDHLRRELLKGQGGSDEIFALAELSFLHAARGGGRAWDMASALYAWMSLPGAGGAAPDPSCGRRRRFRSRPASPSTRSSR